MQCSLEGEQPACLVMMFVAGCQFQQWSNKSTWTLITGHVEQEGLCNYKRLSAFLCTRAPILCSSGLFLRMNTGAFHITCTKHHLCYKAHGYIAPNSDIITSNVVCALSVCPHPFSLHACCFLHGGCNTQQQIFVQKHHDTLFDMFFTPAPMQERKIVLLAAWGFTLNVTPRTAFK
jgi:hypothetical protein